MLYCYPSHLISAGFLLGLVIYVTALGIIRISGVPWEKVKLLIYCNIDVTHWYTCLMTLVIFLGILTIIGMAMIRGVMLLGG